TPVSGLYGIGSTAGGGTGRADIRPTRAGAHMFRDGAEGGAQRHARTPRARPPRGSRAAAPSDGATRWRPRLAPVVPALVTDRIAVRRDEVPLGAEPLDVLPVGVARVLVAGVVVQRPAVVRHLLRPVPPLDRAEQLRADGRVRGHRLAFDQQRRPRLRAVIVARAGPLLT